MYVTVWEHCSSEWCHKATSVSYTQCTLVKSVDSAQNIQIANIIWMGKNEYGQVEIWVDGWWTGKKLKEQKHLPKTIDISYALKVSENVVTCVCSPFQVIRHI